MGNPTAPRSAMADMARRPVDEDRAKAEALLRRIEAEGLVSGWVWPRLTDTVAHLTELGDDLAWVVTAYLSAVAVRGDAMFRHQVHQPQLGPVSVVRRTIRCACGADAPADQPTMRSGREVTVATCPECHHALALYDGIPYGGRTLISAAHV